MLVLATLDLYINLIPKFFISSNFALNLLI